MLNLGRLNSTKRDYIGLRTRVDGRADGNPRHDPDGVGDVANTAEAG